MAGAVAAVGVGVPARAAVRPATGRTATALRGRARRADRRAEGPARLLLAPVRTARPGSSGRPVAARREEATRES
ncbi:hypothetical protein [Saccharopolyspora sp. CA-218241]|uniref:hypothetical protein n=1 Tax=Saccharopolyspora sp. CA-218241 TaxID=3240027 RepID=UPI003D97B20D